MHAGAEVRMRAAASVERVHAHQPRLDTIVLGGGRHRHDATAARGARGGGPLGGGRVLQPADGLGVEDNAGHVHAERLALERGQARGEQRLGRVGAPVAHKVHCARAERIGHLSQHAHDAVA